MPLAMGHVGLSTFIPQRAFADRRQNTWMDQENRRLEVATQRKEMILRWSTGMARMTLRTRMESSWPMSVDGIIDQISASTGLYRTNGC